MTGIVSFLDNYSECQKFSQCVTISGLIVGRLSNRDNFTLKYPLWIVGVCEVDCVSLEPNNEIL
ncbi:hypothetical protein GL2_36010 [Microbulbifer sp. GL-2]|nr:hypothetical protein GL2_36010 [Microbulbifer sp. GL-2]